MPMESAKYAARMIQSRSSRRMPTLLAALDAHALADAVIWCNVDRQRAGDCDLARQCAHDCVLRHVFPAPRQHIGTDLRELQQHVWTAERRDDHAAAP